MSRNARRMHSQILNGEIITRSFTSHNHHHHHHHTRSQTQLNDHKGVWKN